MRLKETSTKGRRIDALRFFFLFAFGLIVLKMAYLQTVKHSYYVSEASKQHWAFDTVPAKRGLIYVKDTNGELYPLAMNQSLNMLFATPKEIENREEVAEKLAPIIKKDKKEILEDFKKSEIYVPMARRLDEYQSGLIEKLDFKGIFLKKEDWRLYPEQTLASQLLGYVNDDGDGQYGMEEFLNDQLKGVPGMYKAESDITGRKIAFGRDVSKKAIDGKDVVLTINRDVQSEAERILKSGIQKFGAEGGSIIVMDPKTGKIMAMANGPEFNPNEYKNNKNYDAFKNKAVLDTYEPGSIMKVITMAMGLDSGKVQPDEKYTDTGSVVLNGHKIMNSDKKAHGEQTMTQVLEESLNTGMVYVLNKIGKSTYFDYLKKFGFGERTGIQLNGEGPGNVLWETDKEHTVATMTFGQSISTTPMQMISSFAAIANGGVLMRPQLIEKIVDKEGKEQTFQPEEIRRVISERTASAMAPMLVSVVEKGHGYQAKIKGYKVAGKTGTAQVPLKNGGGYDPGKNIGSFIGYAPAYTPQFIVLAKVDSPKGVQWAESTAAPMVGEMLDYLLKYYQVPPTEQKELNP